MRSAGCVERPLATHLSTNSGKRASCAFVSWVMSAMSVSHRAQLSGGIFDLPRQEVFALRYLHGRMLLVQKLRVLGDMHVACATVRDVEFDVLACVEKLETMMMARCLAQGENDLFTLRRLLL